MPRCPPRSRSPLKKSPKVPAPQKVRKTTAISFVQAQEQLASAQGKLVFYLSAEVDEKVGLEGATREMADDALRQLAEAQQDLFDRYVRSRLMETFLTPEI
jgi:hypothetical protein